MKYSKLIFAIGLVASSGANALTKIEITGVLDNCMGSCPLLGSGAGLPIVQIVTTDDTTGVLGVGNYIDPGYYHPSSVATLYQPGEFDTNALPYDFSTGITGIYTSDLYIGDNDALINPPPGVTQHYINVEPGNVTSSSLQMGVTNEAVVGGIVSTYNPLNKSFPIITDWNVSNMTFKLQFEADIASTGEFSTGKITSIRVVPIPAAAWLFGTAVMGLTAIARARRVIRKAQ